MRYINAFCGFLCLFAMMANTTLAQVDLEIEERLQKLWTTLGQQQVADAWKMSNEERKQFLSEFNKRLFAGKWGPPDSWDNGDSIRLWLGDRELTKSEVEKLVANPFHFDRGLAASGSPIAIEYLAPYAFSQEPYSESGTDSFTYPLSFTVTSVIFQILSDSPAFTGEVTNWARREKVPDPERQRAELQRWWKENKVHFEKEDYKAVQPGRPIASVFEVEDDYRRKEGLPPLKYRRPQQSTPQALPTTPKPALAPLPAAEVSHFSNALYYIAAAMATLLVAGLAIAAGRKRGNPEK